MNQNQKKRKPLPYTKRAFLALGPREQEAVRKFWRKEKEFRKYWSKEMEKFRQELGFVE